jgi:glycosyltransferase involved in cell wall biosynthesis
MRTLVVSSFPPRHCGIGAYARDQVARMRAAGDDVVVLSPPDCDGAVRVPFDGGRPFARAAAMARGYHRVVVHFQPALYYRPRAPLSKVATSLALLWLVWRCRWLERRSAGRTGRLEILVHEADPPVGLWPGRASRPGRRGSPGWLGPSGRSGWLGWLGWRPDYLVLRWAFVLAPRLRFHTEAEWRALEASYRARVRGGVIPHRVEAARPAGSKAEARRLLGVEPGGFLFVCPGFLQPSKGFDRAVDAFAEAGLGRDGAALVVVGSVRESTPEVDEHVRDLRRRCATTPGAALVEGFVSDREYDLWVAAADRVVLPYRRSWSSGVLARAQALGTPAIVAAAGGLAEQAGPADVVVRDDRDLARAMLEAVTAGSVHAGEGAR